MKFGKRAVRSLVAAAMTVAMLLSLVPATFAAEAEKKATITVLQTSDLHGMVNPFDYAANKE
ncbi:MAG: hypothetical protein RR403_06135, partial [Pseudoflavonifractor sp.]